MSALTGRTQNDTYLDLLHIENSNLGFDATLRVIESGSGDSSSLQLSTLSARFTGTLEVVGVTSFDVVPNVGGSDLWYPGNDGPGSGLDADTLDGLEASAFAVSSDPLTITGAWEFQTAPLFSRANNLELAQFQDTTNNIQMQALFNTDLDFSLIPGTGSVFTAADRLYFDSTEAIWSTVNGFNITGTTGILSIGPGNSASSNTFGDLTILSEGGDLIFNSNSGGMDLSADGGDFTVFASGIVDILADDEIDITSGGVADIILTAGGELDFKRDGGTTIAASQDPSAATTTSAMAVQDGSAIFRDVGFNVMPNDNQAASFTLGVTNVGHKERYTGVGAHTATLTDEANIPDGGTWVVVNAGTGTLTISITTLTWYDGSGTIQTGSRTLAIAGVCTITKRIDGQYEIWGAGLT